MSKVESTPEMASAMYSKMDERLKIIRKRLNKPLTLADKILYGHVDDPEGQPLEPGKSQLFLRPDRVVLQDVLGQSAFLQFMQTRRNAVAVPTSTVRSCRAISPAGSCGASALAARRARSLSRARGLT